MSAFNEKDFDKAYNEETKKINKQLDKDIIFAMIGDINTGKSSTINQLIGDDVAKVGARPGETIGIDKYVYRDKIIFADTPGLDDINHTNSEETFRFYREADVILFFLNAAGTVFSEGERKSFETIRKENKQIVFILNKIDAADDIPALVQYVKEHTSKRYPVIPISSRTGENIDKLRNEILEILKKKRRKFNSQDLLKKSRRRPTNGF